MIPVLTSREVAGARSEARVAFDVLTDDPRTRAFLGLDGSVADAVARHRSALIDRLEDAPDIFGAVAPESDWRLVAEAYAHPAEIAYQARILEIAPHVFRAAKIRKIWPAVHAEASQQTLRPLDANRVVALATLSPRLPQASPRTFTTSSVVMVLAPLGWALLAEIWSGAFTHHWGAAHGTPERAWAALLSTETSEKRTVNAAARPFWAGLAAHVIASAATFDALSAFGAADAAATSDGPLKGALIGCENWGDDAVRSGLARAAVDFSFAHEIAHVARGDHESHVAVVNEVHADFLAVQGYFSSWGWRDEFFAGAPLSDVGRVPLGVWMFAEIARALVAVRRLVGRHGLIGEKSVAQLAVAERNILSRLKELDHAVAEFLNVTARTGAWAHREADMSRLKAFRTRALTHERAAHAWWNGLAPDAVRAAADLAREAASRGDRSAAPSAPAPKTATRGVW